MDRSLPGRARDWWERARFAYELAAPRRYLLVMSHMRSYSSLLCHILNSHPAMNGYVEMHKAYTTPADLVELSLRVRHTSEQPLSGRYVVDKLLHNYADVSERMLQRRDVFALFVVREPESTVRSIIAMGLKRETLDWKSDPPKVTSYYVKRLRRLVEFAEHKLQRSMYLEADRLIDDTERALQTLQDFLDLEEPLRPRYATGALTGRRKYGDPSPYIQSGRIVRERDDYSHIAVAEPLLVRAREAYEESRLALSKACEFQVSKAGAQL